MAHHHDHDHRCAEVEAAEAASAQRRSSVSSLVSRISTSPVLSPLRRGSSFGLMSPVARRATALEAISDTPGELFLPPATLEEKEATAKTPTEMDNKVPIPPIEEKPKPRVLVPPPPGVPLQRKSTWTQAEEETAADGFVPKCKWYLSTFTWSRWAAEDVSTVGLIPALVIQALATGILDATTYADFATFASNQTGNCIVLTLAAIRLHRNQVLLTGTSFAAFLVAAFIFGQVGHLVGVRRRGWLLFNQFIQVILLVIAAVLISPAGPTATLVGGKQDWAVLMLFAAMSGQQVAMARQSSCAELPTAPMTSTFVDFVADHYLFSSWSDPKAAPRNRRVYYVVAMIGGSFIGAALHKYTASWPVVVLTLLLKMVAWLVIAFAKPD